MDRLLDLAKKITEKIKSTQGTIQLVSHYDADGISSAAIMTYALKKLNKNFKTTILKKIKEENIETISQDNPELVIFCDIGSSYLDEISKLKTNIIIADHHEISDNLQIENLIHMNPELFDLENISGSTVTFLIGRELTDDEDLLLPIALIGALGDSTIPNTDFFSSAKYIKLEKGLNLFGRYSRPVHKALEMCSDPFIPGVSGSESKALQFLNDIGIEPKDNGSWKTIGDLSGDETRKLIDSIILEHLKHKQTIDIEELFGNIWILEDYTDELRDAKEFATMLNCCGRLDKGEIGIKLCLKEEGSLDEVRNLMKNYRRRLGNYLKWVEDNPDKTKNYEYGKYIIAGNSIHENMIGTIISILSKYNKDIPVIGMANSDDGVKVSGRALNGMNINKIVSEAAIACGGRGGGHAEAAGATIPRGSEEDFVKKCNDLIEKSVQR
jgi:RecJ-like exonuclease